MKTIENKTTTIFKSEGVYVNYSDLLTAVLNKPIPQSISLKDMRRDIKLMDKFEDATDSIELSDDEFKHVSGLVENSEWAIKHIDIIAFADYIESLS